MSETNDFTALVIGGSVGGLAAAHELRDVGAGVAVYERSAGQTSARGAGIVMQPEVDALLNRLGRPASSVSVELHERQQLDARGRTARHGAPQLMTAWDTLYRALREPLSGVCYRLDSTLRRVQVSGHDITAEFSDGYTARGNFLVGADGIGSATRMLLDSVSRPEYAGYVAWRGLEPESALPSELLDLLAGRFTFFTSSGMQMLCYLVPGADGEREEGSRRVNWVWYVNVAEPDRRGCSPAAPENTTRTSCRRASCSPRPSNRSPGRPRSRFRRPSPNWCTCRTSSCNPCSTSRQGAWWPTTRR